MMASSLFRALADDNKTVNVPSWELKRFQFPSSKPISLGFASGNMLVFWELDSC